MRLIEEEFLSLLQDRQYRISYLILSLASSCTWTWSYLELILSYFMLSYIILSLFRAVGTDWEHQCSLWRIKVFDINICMTRGSSGSSRELSCKYRATEKQLDAFLDGWCFLFKLLDFSLCVMFIGSLFIVWPTFLSIKNLSLRAQWCFKACFCAQQRAAAAPHEPTAVVALVLRFAPPRLATDLPSPQVLRDDGAVRVNRSSLKTRDN